MYKENKKGRKLEKYFKGASNHTRIDILFILEKESGLSLEEISGNFKSNYKTIGEHTRKLLQAGLINKNNVGRRMEHSLSPYGKRFIKFMRTF